MATEQAGVSMPVGVTRLKYSNRVVLKTILERSDGGLGLVGERVVIGGWVRSSKEVTMKDPLPPSPSPSPLPKSDARTGAMRPKDASFMEILHSRIPFFRSIMKVLGGGNYNHIRENSEQGIPRPPPPSIAFLQVSDGSCVSYLQVVVASAIASPCQLLPTGTCILVEGVLMQLSEQGKHVIELKVDKILYIGTVDHEKYPLSKKKLPFEMLRDFSQFRPRTTTVTTLLGKPDKTEKPTTIKDTEGVSLEVIKSAAKEKAKLVEELKKSESNKEALAATLQDFQKPNEASHLKAREKSKPGTSLKPDKVNFSEDFFSCRTYLTVSGCLHLESYACALGNVYSIGPRFRADCAGHVAERLMIEIEMAFAQLEDAMSCADDFFKFLCKWVLDNCPEDMKFVSKRIDKTRIDRLQSMIYSKVEKITYTEVVDVLGKVADQKFEVKLQWGAPLTAEHLSYLVEVMFKNPVMIYNYPKGVKPFYARLNDDRKTVAAFDLVLPKARILISGSQNEERLDILSSRIKELGLPREQYEWYLDLRRHGTVEHSGFSLGFDNMVLFATGLTDAVDVIPFPRSYGKANN
ncbi:hypothetical protein I3842_14G045900 [Carya illinoinensis]|uniref:Aminoacyl-tRNA synthetase class II (D/K/N) domain-containing protein n=1 Tax=Carya illinoinensis TaxID=32201 RepID=A0A922AJA2_CARIL|nr:hypothetical protein I3842_14G045900 [Carya illinoinensis]